LNTNKLREIDRLVSEMHDDGLAGDDMRQLEHLLTDDPIAQKHYWQLVSTHVALCVAVSSNPGQMEPSWKRSGGATPAHTPNSPKTSRSRFSFFRPPWLLAAAAAVLLVGFVALLNRSGRMSNVGLPRVASQSPFRTSLEQMPTITQVSWEGPSFATNAGGWQPAANVSAGAVTLHVNEGEVADGYLFCLMPGESVKLVATFDATGENSLSVVEIAGSERATVKKVSFHNSGAGPKPLHANPAARDRRYGVLGHWSEVNTTEYPRHFLLTGVHKLANPSPTESWRLSKIAVLIEDETVVHIGWDDSGPAPADGEAYHEDYDYDDLAASLIFTRDAEVSQLTRGGLRAITNLQPTADTYLSLSEDGHEFDLPPETAAVFKAASEANDLNAMMAIDVDTQEVLWSSSKELTQSTNLGAACVINPTSTTKRIRIVGIHKPHDSKGPGVPWRVSAFKTLYEQPRFFIVGFDDSVEDSDFNDVRVSVLMTPMFEQHGT
jgi:hypothetical protein